MDREEAHQLFDERTSAAESVITVCHCSVKIFITSSLLWVKSAIRERHSSLFQSVHRQQHGKYLRDHARSVELNVRVRRADGGPPGLTCKMVA